MARAMAREACGRFALVKRGAALSPRALGGNGFTAVWNSRLTCLTLALRPALGCVPNFLLWYHW